MNARTGRKPRRSLRLEWIEAGSLSDNPRNWRTHPDNQVAALRDLIEDDDVGWAGACLYNERTKRLLDGHARKSIVDPAEVVPVLVGSWSEAAERKILATLDTIGGMAGANAGILRSLLGDVTFQSPDLSGLLSSLRSDFDLGADEVELKQLPTQRPPAMTWVLIGIPTVRFGEIAETVDAVAQVEGVVCETTANDG